MGILTRSLTLPIAGPLLGLGWLARRIAETALAELNDPARIEAELLMLERALDAGEIDEPAFEAREAELLTTLAALQAGAAGAMSAEPPAGGVLAVAPDDGATDPAQEVHVMTDFAP
jgi:glucose-6-phosphate dehydrogenase assembly protein OpcA